MSTRPVRTRYAPSPTGFQHIGGIRTALFAYLFARQNNGRFILRIEDTDRSRFVEGAENYIAESLGWLGIDIDEGPTAGGNYGPYRQSERSEIYRRYAAQLIDSGHAYYAFDTPDELTAAREADPNFKYGTTTRDAMNNSLGLSPAEVDDRLDGDYIIRLKVPVGETVIVSDRVRGQVAFDTAEIDDKVLFKSDGMPTYHLANVVDDHLMEITHVIRGEEWLPSTPLHVLLYRALGWEDSMPEFAHLPLLLNPDSKGKLSKRSGDRLGFPVFPLAWQHPDNDTSSNGYREMGFLPDAFVNFLALLGWSSGSEQEIFSRRELIDAFSLDRVSKSGAKFNFEKAKWFNQQYLIEMNDAKLAEAVAPFAPENRSDIDRETLKKLVPLFKERIELLPEFWQQAEYMFAPPDDYDAKTVRTKWKGDNEDAIRRLAEAFVEADEFTAATLNRIADDYLAENDLKFGNVLLPIRVALTGVRGGPSIFSIAELLGRDEVKHRFERAFAEFEQRSQTAS